MKTYKIVPFNPESPLHITQNMCEQCSSELQKTLGHYYKKILPTKREFLYDKEFYWLYYLNSALNILKNSYGFDSHVEQYNNNPQTAFFVTLLADILAGHALEVSLEPEIPGHPKRPDIYAKPAGSNLGIYFECKNPIDPNQDRLLIEQQPIFDCI